MLKRGLPIPIEQALPQGRPQAGDMNIGRYQSHSLDYFFLSSLSAPADMNFSVNMRTVAYCWRNEVHSRRISSMCTCTHTYEYTCNVCQLYILHNIFVCMYSYMRYICTVGTYECYSMQMKFFSFALLIKFNVKSNPFRTYEYYLSVPTMPYAYLKSSEIFFLKYYYAATSTHKSFTTTTYFAQYRNHRPYAVYTPHAYQAICQMWYYFMIICTLARGHSHDQSAVVLMRCYVLLHASFGETATQFSV